MLKREQLQYAVERLDGLHAQKIAAIRAASVKHGNSMSVEEVLALFKAGKLKIANPKLRVGVVDKERSNRYRYSEYPKINEVFNLSGLITDDTVDSETVTKKINTLAKEYEKVKDQLILGDAQEALKLLEQFAKL